MKKIFEKEKIGSIELKNRFIRSGTWMAKATDDGYVSDELIEYYQKLAEGNIGFVNVGYSRVLEDEMANRNMIGMWDDKFIPGLKRLTNIFHQNNTPVGIQIAIGGTQIHYKGDVTWKIMSPSAIDINRKDSFGNNIIYKVEEMSKEEIEYIIKAYADAALRVKKAGFDMVQIHGAHGYFVSQWMNPNLNTREDEYGQDKTKFVFDLYKAVREKVGTNFLVSIKINSEEELGNQSNYTNVLELCKKLDMHGINMIEISGNSPSRTKVNIENESYFKEFAKILTHEVGCKVMLTGGNKTFSNIEEVLNETDVDFIGLSRVLVSESDLVKKWEKDKEYKSRCVSCNHCHRDIYTCVFDVKRG